MGSDTAGLVIQLLLRWNSGEEACFDELIPLVAHELRLLPTAKCGRTRGPYAANLRASQRRPLKLVDQARQLETRAHFLGVASKLTRRILVDHARDLWRAKRGGAVRHPPLEEEVVFTPAKSASLVALDNALQDLSRFDSRKARVVELSYVGGGSGDR